MFALAPTVAATAAGTAGRSWPDVILILGLLFVGITLIGIVVATVSENRKVKIDSTREADVRQLVDRYEQLAEKTMDAQQRIATEVAELRTRLAAVEQILRSVE
jgi:hypothetical protein